MWIRDSQSLIATRMTMDEMRPILPAIDEVGYYSVECWGGATFDACIRFLDEDPWERLRILRKETVSYTHLWELVGLLRQFAFFNWNCFKVNIRPIRANI